eukprot:scaffold84846_cov72-Cyclotella_meneghiniana.AAC.1
MHFSNQTNTSSIPLHSQSKEGHLMAIAPQQPSKSFVRDISYQLSTPLSNPYPNSFASLVHICQAITFTHVFCHHQTPPKCQQILDELILLL